MFESVNIKLNPYPGTGSIWSTQRASPRHKVSAKKSKSLVETVQLSIGTAQEKIFLVILWRKFVTFENHLASGCKLNKKSSFKIMLELDFNDLDPGSTWVNHWIQIFFSSRYRKEYALFHWQIITSGLAWRYLSTFNGK